MNNYEKIILAIMNSVIGGITLSFFSSGTLLDLPIMLLLLIIAIIIVIGIVYVSSNRKAIEKAESYSSEISIYEVIVKNTTHKDQNK